MDSSNPGTPPEVTGQPAISVSQSSRELAEELRAERLAADEETAANLDKAAGDAPARLPSVEELADLRQPDDSRSNEVGELDARSASVTATVLSSEGSDIQGASAHVEDIADALADSLTAPRDSSSVGAMLDAELQLNGVKATPEVLEAALPPEPAVPALPVDSAELPGPADALPQVKLSSSPPSPTRMAESGLSPSQKAARLKAKNLLVSAVENDMLNQALKVAKVFGSGEAGDGCLEDDFIGMKPQEPDPDSPLAVLEQAANEPRAEAKPCLYYSPYAGRGELTRLISALGGLEIEEKELLEDKAPFGSPGSWPCLEHGDVKISQSFAIEMYIASISPAFSNLTSVERAIDKMFCKIKEDVYQGFASILSYTRAMRIASTMSEDAEATTVEDIAKVGDKWFPLVEARLPTDGFINGLSFPTVADLAVLNMLKAFMPFSATCDMGGYDISARFPRLVAHVARVAEYPAVRDYLETSVTIDADPFGLRNVRLSTRKESAGATYERDPSWIQSATTAGRGDQQWAANVLGTLARDSPDVVKRKRKQGLKPLSTNSILRGLGIAPGLEQKFQANMLKGSASSPSIGNSAKGQQGSNSIRSQLTSPADSEWLAKPAPWTPPSPPAPSSAPTGRSDFSQLPQSVPNLDLPSSPATGLRLSPCNSATSQKALLASIARTGVPGLDLTRVHMGFDDDEETEDGTGAGGVGQGKVNLFNPNAEVPQLDMSTVQMDGASNSCPSKESSGKATSQKDYSQGKMRLVSSTGDLRPIVAGAGQFPSLQHLSGRSRDTGYPSYGYTVDVDTAGHVVAGTSKKVPLNAPVGVRLPPVSKVTKGKKAAVSHVHMHHHLHYHVNKNAGNESFSR